MSRTTSFALLIIFAVVTYVVTFYGIQPAVKKFAMSGVFSDESDVRGGNSQASLGEMANMHCKQFIVEALEDQQPIQFPEHPTTLLTVGDPISGRFLIKSNLDLTTTDAGSPRRNYVCQIKLEGGDISDIENWTLISQRIWEEKEEEL